MRMVKGASKESKPTGKEVARSWQETAEIISSQSVGPSKGQGRFDVASVYSLGELWEKNASGGNQQVRSMGDMIFGLTGNL